MTQQQRKQTDEKKDDAADDTEKPDVDLSAKKLAFVFISSLITS